jgi:hypothetical protein
MRCRRRRLRQLRGLLLPRALVLLRRLLLQPPPRKKSNTRKLLEIIRAASTVTDFVQARALFDEYAAGSGSTYVFSGFINRWASVTSRVLC